MISQQWVALGVFALSYGLIISNWVHRTIASIVGAILVHILVLEPNDLLHYENWETLIFILGMMIVIATMERGGFFRWLGLHATRWVKLDPLKLYILFPFMAGFMAAFVDSITVMLFMSTLTLEVARRIGMNPLPLILAEITAANIGGASTMVGDPPNVILGTYFHLSFMDFASNTGIFALIGFVVNTLFFITFYRRDIFPVRRRVQEDLVRLASDLEKLKPVEAILDKRLFRVGLGVFFYVVILLVTHHMTGLSVATIAITGACLGLLLGGPIERMPKVLEEIDWNTLLFFAGLFLIVGGMEEVGLLKMAAEKIGAAGGGNYFAVLSIILWFSALGSSIVDNVPFAASMTPILKHLSNTFGFNLLPLIWSAALGADIGGNGTPIGASANVVALATYERATGRVISWGYYCKSCYPAMMLVVGICNLLIYLIYV